MALRSASDKAIESEVPERQVRQLLRLCSRDHQVSGIETVQSDGDWRNAVAVSVIG